jgi:hypothetical protein
MVSALVRRLVSAPDPKDAAGLILPVALLRLGQNKLG